MVPRFGLPGGLLVVGLLVVVGYVTSSTSASGQRLLGDVDCNQQVNSIDAALILQEDAGLISDLDCGDAADVSHDGRTNAVDAALILQVTAGLLEGFGKIPSVPTLVSTATPPPSTTPHNTATPPPLPTPSVECSPWPPEVSAVLERLPVPAGLCLVRLSDESEVPPNRRPCNPGCYYGDLRQVWCIATCEPPDGSGGETAVLVHELCHAHQHRTVLDANVPFNVNVGWGRPGDTVPVEDSMGLAYFHETNEGRSFIELGAWRFENGEWIEEPELGWSGYANPLEDAANTCSVFYWNSGYLPNYAPIRHEWAKMWLPELPESTVTPPTTPTPTPSVECSPWPDEVAAVLERLPVVEGLCLIRLPGPSAGPYYDSNVPAAVCPGDCSASIPVGEVHSFTHEVCHSHEHRVVLDAGIAANFKVGWGKDQIHAQDDAFGLAYVLETDEGRSFVERGTWSLEGGEWVQQPEPGSFGSPNPYEDAAETCAFWFVDRDFLRDNAPIRYEWAQTWLPE